ncbi:MoaD/ThiS family protein [Desulfobaculum bizertense]|uniref:Molybdopterin converting factor, small subunit n=1 Tax=Desulfobaculum bizertense DSM 18034 TaxID=1121442 RepID=A0A1T4WBE4_9BACT|nr:MoaD/ThiS family protein [Desulfobaculum bizertense]SKA74517.1 Molybdopterin converting factor, small subunit [Desulfobaculum bizertense DSM 18034]
MKINVKCFATLSTFDPKEPENFEVPDGITVAQLIELLGIEREEVKIMFINSTHVKDSATIQDGDRVGLFPAVGGG